MTIKSLRQAVELSIDFKDSKELDAAMPIVVNGERWNCYTIAMGHREFTCYCTEGTATFVVDTYGDRYIVELFDWEKDET